jgi:hypothetical protein
VVQRHTGGADQDEEGHEPARLVDPEGPHDGGQERAEAGDDGGQLDRRRDGPSPGGRSAVVGQGGEGGDHEPGAGRAQPRPPPHRPGAAPLVGDGHDVDGDDGERSGGGSQSGASPSGKVDEHQDHAGRQDQAEQAGTAREPGQGHLAGVPRERGPG